VGREEGDGVIVAEEGGEKERKEMSSNSLLQAPKSQSRYAHGCQSFKRSIADVDIASRETK
jgi:hypothetical protein